MWVDESGGTDANGTEALTVHVDGQEYQAEVNYDTDHDGVSDTAVVEHDDGSAQAFADTDHDGVADHYAVLDATGHVVDQAVYDEQSGSWVESGTGQPGSDGTDTHSGGPSDTSTTGHINADLPDGNVDAGVATIDTDHDGHNDTAVVETKSGGTIAFTDTNGDGQADIAVQVGADGSTHTFEHTGQGQWTEADGTGNHAAATDPGSDSAWGGEGAQLLSGVAKIDSGTGQWISPN